MVRKGQKKEAFCVYDIKSAEERIALWRTLMPRVEIFYAVKTNPNTKIVEKCLESGTGFDVASEAEIRQVMLQGGDPQKCIFASPIKKVSGLEAAKKFGLKKMTFDSSEELHKIHRVFPEAEVVLRIATEQTNAIYNLSEKFGSPMEDVPELLETANKLGLRVKGVAFHVGSGGVTVDAYQESLINARKVFDMAKKMGMKPMDLLDIGGGFTMVAEHQPKNFTAVAPVVSRLIDQIFPESEVRVIAEPGRYISESVVYHAATIIG